MAAQALTNSAVEPRNIKPNILFRLEGLALLGAALALYATHDFAWWLFALLLLAPDLAALGYFISVRVGNLSYNITHVAVLPLALAVAAALTGHPFGVQFALIWLAHIGMDRTVGYGLKDTAAKPQAAS